MDGGGDQCVERDPVDLAQIDVQVGAAVLGQLELACHIISQLAKDTDALALAQDISGNTGVQPGNVRRALDGQLDAERSAEALDSTLDCEEVLLTAPGSKAQMQTLLGQFGDGQLLRDVDVGHLEQAALGVALAQVVDDDIQQGRCQQRAHDGQMGGNGVQDTDDLALRRVSGNVQHVEVSVGVKGQRLGLVEALGTHGALGLGLRFLLGGQAAGGDGGSLQEGGDDVFIAVLADDLLGQVGLTDLDVLTPAGRDDLHRVAVGFEFDLELQAVQDVQNHIGGHSDAEDGIDAADLGRETLALTRGTGRTVKMGGGDLAAAQLLNQVQGTGHAKLGGVLGDALLVMAGGIGVLAEAAGRLADVVAGELGALKQQLGGGIFNFAVQAAHDTRQRNGLGAVADDEVVGRQGEFFFVQRCDLLAVFGAADEDLAAFQRVHVEGVHGLANLQHDIVRDVNDVGDAAQTAQGQLTAHPAWGLARRDVADIMANVARAEILGLDADGQARIHIVADRVVGGGHLEGLVQHCCNLARNAEHTLAVGAVGRDGNIKNVVVKADDLLNGRAGDSVLRQIEQAVDLGTGVQIIVQAQFLTAAQHTVGLDAHQGLRLDFYAAGQRGAVECGGGVHTGVDVGCAGGNLDVVAVLAAVNLADVQMGAFLRDTLGHNTDNDLGDLAAEVDQLLDLKAAAKELVLKLLRGDVDVNILLQPAEWYFHTLYSSPVNPRTASRSADRFQTSDRCC